MDMSCKSRIDAFPWRFSLVLLLPWLEGCGSELVPVSGTVRLDGKPVAKAGILFQPVEGGVPASSATDAQGHFHMETGNRPGVMPGEYHIMVAKQRVSGIGEDERPLRGGIKVEFLIPEKYGNPKASPLRATVGRGSVTYNFDLVSHE